MCSASLDDRTSRAQPTDTSETRRRGDSTAARNQPAPPCLAPRASMRDKMDVSTDVSVRCHCRSCRDIDSLISSILFYCGHRLPQTFTDKKTEFFDLCYILVHPWRFSLCSNIDIDHADFKICLIPRMGMTTQSGRLFSS